MFSDKLSPKTNLLGCYFVYNLNEFLQYIEPMFIIR